MRLLVLLTGQDASTDGHIASEGALLVNVATCTKITTAPARRNAQMCCDGCCLWQQVWLCEQSWPHQALSCPAAPKVMAYAAPAEPSSAPRPRPKQTDGTIHSLQCYRCLCCWFCCRASPSSSMLDVIKVAVPSCCCSELLHAPSMASLGVLKPRPTFLYQRRPALPGILTLAAVFLILHRA